VSFHNNGSTLLVVPHHNHVKLFEIADSAKVVVSEEDIKWNGLPFLSGYINNNQELLLGGFNKKVARFIKKGKIVPIQAITPSKATSPQTKSRTRSKPRRDSSLTSPKTSKQARVFTVKLPPRAITSTQSKSLKCGAHLFPTTETELFISGAHEGHDGFIESN
jgi:hypothetical protein